MIDVMAMVMGLFYRIYAVTHVIDVMVMVMEVIDTFIRFYL